MADESSHQRPRRKPGRRSGLDRRSGADRRGEQAPIDFPDRRKSGERRKGERRSGKDRRAPR